MKGVLPWLVRWACRSGTLDCCPGLAALVSPVQNIIFLYAHFFTFVVPCIAQEPGHWACSRAGSPVSVSLLVSHLIDMKMQFFVYLEAELP
jgi:hypothetical protein